MIGNLSAAIIAVCCRRPGWVIVISQVDFLAEYPLAALPGSQHHTLQRPSVERRVLRLAGQLAGFDFPDAVRVEQAQIRDGALGDAARIAAQAAAAGRAVSRSMAADSVSAPLWTCAKVTASKVAKPEPPAEASANGRRLSSASRG